jgi:hypothetical protein
MLKRLRTKWKDKVVEKLFAFILGLKGTANRDDKLILLAEQRMQFTRLD